ncbi:hypothetical protein J6590_037389 [Homalodisca vitripennis]|nr:hypothetical protein J6590_037389 [Homalodisca vitripennis]
MVATTTATNFIRDTLKQQETQTFSLAIKERNKLHQRRLLCRSELEKLRSGNQVKNDHLTVQWLAGTVAELRSEVAELSGSVNRTEELAAREALGEEVRMVRGDVTALRRDLDVLRAEQEARVGVLAEELREVKAHCLRKGQNLVGYHNHNFNIHVAVHHVLLLFHSLH